MNWIEIYYWIAGGFTWLSFGFCLLFWIDGLYPREMARVCRNSMLGSLLCIAVWPLAIAMVLILANGRRRHPARFHG